MDRKRFNMKPLYSFISLIILLISCNEPSTKFTAQEKQRISDTIRQVLANYNSDIRQHSLMSEFKYLDSSDEFYWVPPGFTSAISYDSVAAIIKHNAAMFKEYISTWDTLRIIPLTKELVNYTGRLHYNITDTSNKTFTGSMWETGLLIRRKDGWKLLCGQTTSL